MNLPERYKIVPVSNYSDLSGDIYTDDINMKGYHKATFVIQFHNLSAGNAIILVKSGATDGAHTTAETFDYALGTADTAAALCDVLGATTSTASADVSYTTYTDSMMIVEIDASAMTDGQEWLSLMFDFSAVNGNATVFAILEPRYKGNQSGTALA